MWRSWARTTGFAGTGDLFIVNAESEIDINDLTIKVRGHDNSKLEFKMGESGGSLTPRVFALNPNYPNPFNPMTKISFSLPEAQDVRLEVYGIDGRKVATLLNETRGPGLHEVIWNGQDDTGRLASSGMYFYRINAGPYSAGPEDDVDEVEARPCAPGRLRTTRRAQTHF